MHRSYWNPYDQRLSRRYPLTRDDLDFVLDPEDITLVNQIRDALSIHQAINMVADTCDLERTALLPTVTP